MARRSLWSALSVLAAAWLAVPAGAALVAAPEDIAPAPASGAGGALGALLPGAGDGVAVLPALPAGLNLPLVAPNVAAPAANPPAPAVAAQAAPEALASGSTPNAKAKTVTLDAGRNAENADFDGRTLHAGDQMGMQDRGFLSGASSRGPPEETRDFQRFVESLKKRGGYEAVLAMAEKLYYTDSLTGLPNRAFFADRGPDVLEGVENPAVAMFDLNNFSAVNAGLAKHRDSETEGRARADDVLALAGATFAEIGRAQGVIVIRLGGDEFAALGSREAVLRFSEAARATVRPSRLLDAAGIAPGGEEHAAIMSAMERSRRGGQPVGDFTYGVTETFGRPLKDALKTADEALGYAKKNVGRGAVVINTENGFEEAKPGAPGQPLESLPRPPPRRNIREDMARIEALLTPKERALFNEAALKDPLTQTRSYEYVQLKADDWDRYYGSGGMISLISGRNLKQINDILGHDEGDAYLRGLGAIMRSALDKARAKGLDALEPVRVSSKEFLIVGRDAAEVARGVQEEVAAKLAHGELLPPEALARVREESIASGTARPEAAELIGTLRAVSEDIRAANGHADVRGALDRAFADLETAKLSGTAANASASPR